MQRIQEVWGWGRNCAKRGILLSRTIFYLLLWLITNSLKNFEAPMEISLAPPSRFIISTIRCNYYTRIWDWAYVEAKYSPLILGSSDRFLLILCGLCGEQTPCKWILLRCSRFLPLSSFHPIIIHTPWAIDA